MPSEKIITNTDPYIDHDPSFGHLKYLHQNCSNCAQTLCICLSRYSYDDYALFLLRCCGENKIKKTTSVTQADGCRVGDSTAKRDRATRQVPFSACLLNEHVSQLRVTVVMTPNTRPTFRTRSHRLPLMDTRGLERLQRTRG